jgi:DNA-binding transcriptional regulator YiaG
MTPEEFKNIRERLGLSAYRLADIFQVRGSRTIRRWETGDRDIPGPAKVLISLLGERPELLAAIRKTPPI